MAVPGRPPENESGDVERISVGGMARDIESRERREKIVFKVSKRGRMTVSRYAIRTMRRTSRTAAPQKSRAISGDMRVPWPANSRSRGRKTACM